MATLVLYRLIILFVDYLIYLLRHMVFTYKYNILNKLITRIFYYIIYNLTYMVIIIHYNYTSNHLLTIFRSPKYESTSF